MKITPIQALNDNYIWMIQEGNHAACVDPSDATPVLKFLVHNRLMLAQTWITHPHPDHTGGAKSLFHGFLESPIYGESDIDVATHTVTAGTQFPFGEGLVTVWATPGHTDRHISYLLENSDGLHVFCGDTLFSAGCGRVFTGTIEQLYDSFHRFNQLSRRNTVFIQRTNTPPPIYALPSTSSRTTSTFRRPWPQPNTRRHCLSAWRTSAKSIRFSAYTCPKFRHAPKN